MEAIFFQKVFLTALLNQIIISHYWYSPVEILSKQVIGHFSYLLQDFDKIRATL